MGAQLWYHETAWHPDPATALKTFQSRFMAEKYDLSTLLPDHLANARGAVAAAEAEGDPYELLEMYQKQVRLLEQLCSQPIPQDFEGQIKILRQISASSGQGIGNILDIERISKRRQYNVAQPLSGPELIRLVGTERPTRTQARKAIYRINEELSRRTKVLSKAYAKTPGNSGVFAKEDSTIYLGRGECVCFPIYDSGEKNQPEGCYFVGNTID
ncbi:MAG TPA: hypothetical protein VH575_22235 [Gemmataceae bacterium]|jgi:hypothetical protein